MQKKLIKNRDGGTLADFKNTWQLFKLNYKPFLKTQLFSFLAGFAMMIVVVLLFMVLSPLFPNIQNIADLRDSYLIFLLQAIVATSALFILIFQNCQNGLAYDIMSSGDMYTEFKNSFTYFRKYWWQYLILSLIGFGLPNFVSSLHDFRSFGEMVPGVQPLNPGFGYIEILYEFLSFLWFVLFISTFPSITAQGNIKHALIENFRLLRANPKRMIGTWGMYFLIFQLPTSIFSLLLSITHRPIFAGLTITWAILYLIIGTPLQYLLAAGLYHNIEFKRFKPLMEE